MPGECLTASVSCACSANSVVCAWPEFSSFDILPAGNSRETVSSFGFTSACDDQMFRRIDIMKRLLSAVRLQGDKLSSGVYFYTLRAGDFLQTKKLTVIR